MKRTPLQRRTPLKSASTLKARKPGGVAGQAGRGPRVSLLARVEAACNAAVRARDWGRPCISCGEILIEDYHAGHVRSVGSAAHLRFDWERNIHGQCRRCNIDLQGNPAGLRVFVPLRIGIEAYEALMTDETRRQLREAELLDLLEFFEGKLKELGR